MNLFEQYQFKVASYKTLKQMTAKEALKTNKQVSTKQICLNNITYRYHLNTLKGKMAQETLITIKQV